MPAPESSRRGAWGEAVAAEYLVREGWTLLGRNVRPCAVNRRLEIDLIVCDRRRRVVVFVEVKQHASHQESESLLRSIDRRKRRSLAAACRAWLAANRWRGEYRFDVVQVYGTPDDSRRPEIQHAKRVQMFAPADRFVRWCD